MNNQQIVRQGDVAVLPVDKLPKTAVKQTPPRGGRIIVARGEATGHHHSVDIRDADWWKDGDTDYIVGLVDAPPMTHEEHGTVLLPRIGKVIRQQEYTPKEIRRVAD